MVQRKLYELKVVREARADYEGAPPQVFSPKDCHAVMRSYFDPLDREHFVVVLLDTKGNMLGFNVVSMGTVNQTLVHPREVFKTAIIENAASIVLMHNHPSGDATPSTEDLQLTKRLVKAGDILGIDVLDHIVVGRGEEFVSLRIREKKQFVNEILKNEILKKKEDKDA